MATKKNTAPAAVVTVKELCEEFKLDPKKCRAIIRSLGFNAPATGAEGFAPKAKYEWTEGHADLTAIREGIAKALAPKDEAPTAEEAPAEAPTKAEKKANTRVKPIKLPADHID